jgi:hypothetical protein
LLYSVLKIDMHIAVNHKNVLTITNQNQ